MAAGFNYETSYQIPHCSGCGREMDQGAGSQGNFYYCYHGEGAIGTMPVHSGMFNNYQSEPDLTPQQKSRLLLIEMNNQKMKRAWKKDQYGKFKGQIRI